MRFYRCCKKSASHWASDPYVPEPDGGLSVAGTEKFWAVETADKKLEIVEGHVYSGRFEKTGKVVGFDEVTLLAPCTPTKIIAAGLNYHDHAAEMNLPVPDQPCIFLKSVSSLLAPGQKIVLPKVSKQVDFEAELGIVVGRCAKNVPPGLAKDYIWGYTCVNDVTARDLQRIDQQWARAKSFDTFCPAGPCVATDLAWAGLDLKLFRNKKVMQSSNTDNFIFPPEKIFSFISQFLTLCEGDLILTGTPGGIGPMCEGDSVEVVIEHVGSLQNDVGSDP